MTRGPKASEQPQDGNNHLNSHDPLESDTGHEQNVEDGDDQSHIKQTADTEQTPESRFSSSDCNDVEETGKELVVKSQGSDNEDCVSPDGRTDFLEKTEKDTNSVNDKGKEEANNKWITVG